MECIVYIEAIKNAGLYIYDVVVDFRTKQDLMIFRRFSNNNAGFGEDGNYCIRFDSLKSTRRLMQGCYYKLNLVKLDVFDFEKNDESACIGRQYILNNMERPVSEEDELLQSHSPLDSEELLHNHVNDNIELPNDNYDNLKLLVKDVGQGNWNEILDDDKIIVVYDFGANMHASKNEISALINTESNRLRRDNPILVISHWDMDHIMCLKDLTIAEISAYFRKLICADKMKTLTSQTIYDNFISALGAQNVSCLIPPVRTNGITMQRWKNFGVFHILIGENSRNVNYCGICLLASGANKKANLTGDLRLAQADNAYTTVYPMNNADHALVAPHHGGDCAPTFLHYSHQPLEIAISVGHGNQYGHPHHNMMAYLHSLHPYRLRQTDLNGDILIPL